MNEMCPFINRNARPNNNQLITHYQPVSYLLRILQYPVNNTYNTQYSATDYAYRQQLLFKEYHFKPSDTNNKKSSTLDRL